MWEGRHRKARMLKSLEEMMGMSNLVKKTQGFSRKVS